MAIEAIGSTLAQQGVGHLRFAAGVVALAQIGVEDHPRPPAALAVVLPAVFGDDLVEVLAELLQGLAALDGALHRAAQVGQQGAFGGAGYDEGPVVLCRVEVGPGAGGQVDLVPEEGDLLFEW
ncbi:hypothetical protein P4152_11810 [Pseudomonas aeruginosa]|nr:hypothetical protein [Pseudomonas aeruginosa]